MMVWFTVHRDADVSRPVLRRGQSVPKIPKDHEQEHEAHVMAPSRRVPQEDSIRASFSMCWNGRRVPVTFPVASPTFPSDCEREIASSSIGDDDYPPPLIERAHVVGRH